MRRTPASEVAQHPRGDVAAPRRVARFRARRALLAAVVAGAAATLPASISAQNPVTGTVVDGATQQPLSGAQVVIEGTEQGALTDNRGRFLILNAPSATVTLRVVMIGYREATARCHGGRGRHRRAHGDGDLPGRDRGDGRRRRAAGPGDRQLPWPSGRGQVGGAGARHGRAADDQRHGPRRARLPQQRRDRHGRHHPHPGRRKPLPGRGAAPVRGRRAGQRPRSQLGLRLHRLPRQQPTEPHFGLQPRRDRGHPDHQGTGRGDPLRHGSVQRRDQHHHQEGAHRVAEDQRHHQAGRQLLPGRVQPLPRGLVHVQRRLRRRGRGPPAEVHAGRGHPGQHPRDRPGHLRQRMVQKRPLPVLRGRRERRQPADRLLRLRRLGQGRGPLSCTTGGTG